MEPATGRFREGDVASLFGSLTWADSILDGRKEQVFGPYFVNPKTGCLMLLGEIRRHQIEGYTASPGWQTFSQDDDYSLMLWVSAGVPDILRQRTLRRVIVPAGEEDLPIPNRWDDVLNLYISGKAFFSDQDLYLLPGKRLIYNSFAYARVGGEPLTIFVGYRGHPHSYPLVLTPSVLRSAAEDDSAKYGEYKTWEGYAGNLLREAY